MANKNSTYVQSLVDFLLDTKPYHSKLTEVVEEYRFFDEMMVHFDERLFSSVMTKAAWTYSHFSDGVALPAPKTRIHRVVSPLFRGMTENSNPSENRGAFKVGRDENTDLPLVPYAFDPRLIQGTGLADAFVQRNGMGSKNEALLEGHDVFLSKGAYVFSIKQIFDHHSDFNPTFVERRNDGIIAHATNTAQIQALDATNPGSSLSRVRDMLNLIQTRLDNAPDALSQSELNAVKAVADAGALPTTYEGLINALKASTAAVVGGYPTWDAVHDVLASYTTSLYRNFYGESAIRESAALSYDDVLRSDVNIKNIVAADRDAIEEFTLEYLGNNFLQVTGSYSNQLGLAIIGERFEVPQVSFDVEAVGTVELGTKISLTPKNKIVVHRTAPLESWSIIKVNPMAYSRPVFDSTRYGYVMDEIGTHNQITILDKGFPTSTIVLTALNETQFTVTDTSEPLYIGQATVGAVYNDGRLAFTIMQGSAYKFRAGDKFMIEVQNVPPKTEDLDLYYGFDMDPYGGPEEYVYDAVNSAVADYMKSLEFGWDSRFTSYDLESFGLKISPGAVERQWRLRAIPNQARPLAQRAPADNRVNLKIDESTPQFDMPNDVTSEGPQSATDPDNAVDIRLWYADSFSLEWYNEATSSWVPVATVPVGSSYKDANFEFTLVPGNKPFIGARVHYSSSWNPTGSDIEGGDVIYWGVLNKDPEQSAAQFVSPNAPRLVMYGDSYQFSTPAKWLMTFKSGSSYELQGVYTTGELNGTHVFTEPVTIEMNSAGTSYVNETFGLHFTVKVGGAGVGAGDKITFETYERKPQFMVYGSVSGWQPDAEFDKYYWNGKIGFKIHTPDVALFENGTKCTGAPWNTSVGQVSVTSIRPDTPSSVYSIRSLAPGQWTLYKNGEVVGNGTTSVSDKFIHVSLPSAVVGTILVLNVVADDLAFALGHDLAIVRTTPGRMPTSSDFIVLNRTKQDAIGISIKPVDVSHVARLAPLVPATIDLRFVDHQAASGIPLANTSPETAVLSGWLPTLQTKYDIGSSLAEFSDPTRSIVVRSATTGETIGTVASTDGTTDEPYYFTWDSSFVSKYLPLNTEATIVTYGSGMNDHVRVNMTEGIQFLLSGGGLDEDALFHDSMTVHIAEDPLELKIKSTYNTDVTVTFDDKFGPGFLPGYDTLPYDAETDDGYYDAGQVLTDQFMRARELALKNVLTPQEQAEYNDLADLLVEYTEDPATMTLDQFIALIDADDAVNSTPSNVGFGRPAVGLGIAIEQQNKNTASTKIVEAMAILAVDSGYTYDAYTYDVGQMDTMSETTAMIYSSDLPPLPAVGLPAPGTLYADFETPLQVAEPGGRIIEIGFANDVASTPSIYVWRPDDSQPRLVPIVERVSSRLFRFTLPSAGELKLVIG